MATKIRITVGTVSIEGEFADTPCGRALAENLPFRTGFHVWGDEFYFPVPLDLPLDDTATTKVSIGDIGYWPPGPALAIFFGPTPLSSGNDPVPVSEVNLVGRLFGDPALLRSQKQVCSISVDKA